jgi:AcrR family transcriptional regulator
VKIDSEIERPVRRLRDELKIATAEAILTAAEAVFAEKGLQTARMEEIAARSGVAVGTLYNHFADRSALLEALVLSRRKALLARLDAELDESKGRPFVDQLRGFTNALFEHVAGHFGFFTVLMQERQDHRTMLKELEGRAQKLMQRGLSQKALRSRHTELLGAAFVGLLRGVLSRAFRDPRAEIAACVEAVVDLFLRGAAAQ